MAALPSMKLDSRRNLPLQLNLTRRPIAAIYVRNYMKKTTASSTPVPAVNPNKSNPFPWSRRPTPVLGQVQFDFEAFEEKGDTPCE